MNNENAKVIELIWERIKDDNAIEPNMWGVYGDYVNGVWRRKSKCCPLGAMLDGTTVDDVAPTPHVPPQLVDLERSAAVMLGVSQFWIIGFVNGFDSCEMICYDDCEEGWRAGMEIKRRWCEKWRKIEGGRHEKE